MILGFDFFCFVNSGTNISTFTILLAEFFIEPQDLAEEKPLCDSSHLQKGYNGSDLHTHNIRKQLISQCHYKNTKHIHIDNSCNSSSEPGNSSYLYYLPKWSFDCCVITKARQSQQRMFGRFRETRSTAHEHATNGTLTYSGRGGRAVFVPRTLVPVYQTTQFSHINSMYCTLVPWAIHQHRQ